MLSCVYLHLPRNQRPWSAGPWRARPWCNTPAPRWGSRGLTPTCLPTCCPSAGSLAFLSTGPGWSPGDRQEKPKLYKTKQNMTVFQNLNKSSHKYMETRVCVHIQETSSLAPENFHLMKTAYQHSHTHPSTLFFPIVPWHESIPMMTETSNNTKQDPRRVANQSPLLRSLPHA